MQPYKIIIIYFAYLQFVSTNDAPDVSGMPKIINGTETSIRYAPFMVNLRYMGQFTCGGALVTPKCVLTAAHCVYGKSAREFTAHAGSSLLSEEGKSAKVRLGLISASFEPETLDMDVAVLYLDKQLSTHDITTIAVTKGSPSANQNVRLFGWGRTAEDGAAVPDRLQTTKVRVMSREACIGAYAGRRQITDTMFCASVPGERDSCSGDSGGPVIYHREVFGIVSWGIGCGRAQFPGVYTNLTSKRVSSFVNYVIDDICV